MSRHSSNLLPVLGSPGSLKAVFNGPDPRDSTMTDEYVDEIVPDFVQCSIMGSNTPFGRRSRLDDSAGEGLRRNVLVRNAMLSSLERERRQIAEEASLSSPPATTLTLDKSNPHGDVDDEAQFFEDLLLELSGSEYSSPASSMLEPVAHTSAVTSHTALKSTEANDEEDFVQLEANLPGASLHTNDTTPLAAPAAITEARDEATVNKVPQTLVDSCSSAFSAASVCGDSGFTDEVSRPASAASCCTGYPNVCPYPAVSSYVGGSSEELPALIDDDDSDAEEDDDDEAGEVDGADQAVQDFAQAVEAVIQPALLSPDRDASRSRPLSPVTSLVHSVCVDYTTFRDQLSPEPSPPTSPISSASSKGDGDGPSPLLLPSDLGALPSIAELSLQLPIASGADLLARPSRVLAGAWFDHHKVDTSSHASTSADRIHWATSPATYFRSGPATSSTSTLTDFQQQQQQHHHHHRLADTHCTSSYPSVAPSDLADHNIVVHWSR